MIAFWIISVLFVAGALLFVVPPLLAQHGGVRFSRTATNLAVYRWAAWKVGTSEAPSSAVSNYPAWRPRW